MPSRGDGEKASKAVQSKLEAEKKRQEMLKFDVAALPGTPYAEWSSELTQQVEKTLKTRVAFLSDSISAEPVGWISVLKKASLQVAQRGGEERTLNYKTSDLLTEAAGFAAKAADLEQKLEKATKESMRDIDRGITELHAALVVFTAKCGDQANGLKGILTDATNKFRSGYQKDYQLDKARVGALVKGAHGEKFGGLIVSAVNRWLQADEAEAVDLMMQALGEEQCNPALGKINVGLVNVWASESAKTTFGKFTKQLEDRKDYVLGRAQDARDALAESAMPGTVAHMEAFDVDPDLFGDVYGKMLFTELAGAQAWMTCHQGMALRAGPQAVVCTGTAMVIAPIDKPVYVVLTPIVEITKLGGITLGSSFTKYMEGDTAPAFFKDHITCLRINVGDLLYVPCGQYIQILLWEEPARGKEKNKTKAGNACVLIQPIAFEKCMASVTDETFNAISVSNQTVFDRKKGKRVWDDKAAWFKKVMDCK